MPLFAETQVSTAFIVIAVLAILAQSLILLSALFAPGLRYRITSLQRQQLDSDEFLYTLEALADAKVNRRTSLQVLTNGEVFYQAELEAIRNAQCSVNLEAYIFTRGDVAQRYLDALSERARAGVRVRVCLDALGSASTGDSYTKALCAAGGQVAYYHPLRWYSLPQFNNRSHRELLIVDGRVGFIGGAGIADHWLISTPGQPRWRDTMVRVEGDAVPNLQGTFAENWLEATGELLTGAADFPLCEAENDTASLVINSTPSAGGSTRARILFQTLIASAAHSIDITTPYFLPDRSLRDELLRAVQRRVRVRVLAPGKHADHMLTRSSGRAAYGQLLEAGAEIYEYRPSMIHAKVLMIDDLWSVVGSTNCDNRSFGLNDEVNLAVRDTAFCARLQQDFAADLAASERVTYQAWRQRSLFERAPELLGWVLERQQ